MRENINVIYNDIIVTGCKGNLHFHFILNVFLKTVTLILLPLLYSNKIEHCTQFTFSISTLILIFISRLHTNENRSFILF